MYEVQTDKTRCNLNERFVTYKMNDQRGNEDELHDDI